MCNSRIGLPCGILALSWALLMCTVTVNADDDDADPFVGIWHLKVTPDANTRQDGAKEFEEALMFEDDQLMAENFAFYGFSAAAYIIPEDQPNKFSAPMESNTKGKLAWSGSIQNNKLTGELIWTRQDGKVWKFTYTGNK